MPTSSNDTTLKYGSYEFSPVPIISNIRKEIQRAGDGTPLGTVFRLTLDGTVTPIPTGTGGITNIITYQDALRNAFSEDGKRLLVQCQNTPLIDCYPRIVDFNLEQSNNNWVFTTPFNIELEFDDEPANSGETTGLMPPYISNADESWSIEFVEENNKFSLDLSNVSNQEATGYYNIDSNPFQLRLTHSVSAQGKRHYGPSGLRKDAWQEAREHVVGQLGLDSTFVGASGVLNLNPNQFVGYNHIRTNNVDQLGGSFSVEENWLILQTGQNGVPTGNATETWSIDVASQLDDITRVSINGEIQGLDTRDYGTTTGDFSISETRYEAAENYWNGVKPRIFSRAQYFGQGESTRSLNPVSNNQTITHNPPGGTIAYSFDYDDRPCNFVTGSISEDIQINETFSTDTFAELIVLGRANGPILQAIGTPTSPERNVVIEVAMSPYTGCDSIVSAMNQKPKSQVDSILCSLEADLTGTYTTVFKTQDVENWNPKIGRYSRNITWKYEDCSGTNSTTVC